MNDDKKLKIKIVAIMTAIVAALIAVLVVFNQPKQKAPVHKPKVERQVKKAESVSSSSESSVASSSSAKPKVDPVPNIKAFFTAYDVYDVNTTAQDRLNKMKQYADETTATNFISNELNAKSPIKGTGKLVKPIQVSKDEGAENSYFVDVQSSITVNGNTNGVENKYMVTVNDDGKITQINLNRSDIL